MNQSALSIQKKNATLREVSTQPDGRGACGKPTTRICHRARARRRRPTRVPRCARRLACERRSGCPWAQRTVRKQNAHLSAAEKTTSSVTCIGTTVTRRGRAHATEHAFQRLPGAPTAPLWQPQPAAATPDTRGGSLSLAPSACPGALRCTRDHPDHRRTSFVTCCTSLSSFFAGGGGGGAIPTLVCCFAVTDS